MIQTHEITLYADAKTNFIHLNAKQYDKNSHRIVCKLSDCTNDFTAEDTAKATAYIGGKTVDVINCSLNATTQKITFILSQNCLAQAGRLLVDVSVFTGTQIKFTLGAFIVDVIRSAEGNISQDIDSGSSLYEKLQEIDDKIDAINLNDVYSVINGLSQQIGFAMKFITETVSISTTAEYKLSANAIAPSSPVYISVKARTSSEDTIVRSDGETLTDILTGNTVDSTMTDIQITAQDVLSGIKATNGMSIQVKYYSANCEDLLQMIQNNSGNGGERLVSPVYNLLSESQSTEVTVTNAT